MIALASPFGEFVGDGVVTVVNGFINTNSKTINEDNIDKTSEKWENKFSTFDKVGSVNNGGSEEEILIAGATFSDGTFKTWNELTSEYIVEDTSMGWGAFKNCENLTSIIIPDSLTYISDNAFVGCKNLTSVNIPNSITTIGVSAFSDCKNLTSIIIPNSVTAIGDCTFYDCSNLASVNIPNTIKEIKYATFVRCVNLTSINIPNSITNIGDYAFYYCSNLTSINYNGTQEQWGLITKGNNWNTDCPQITVHCTDGDIIIPANN